MDYCLITALPPAKIKRSDEDWNPSPKLPPYFQTEW